MPSSVGGGEIAQNLRGLYLLMNRRLLPANVPKDPQMIREVIARMEDLNQSYETITG
jgi:flagellin-specific chaperone FliS